MLRQCDSNRGDVQAATAKLATGQNGDTVTSVSQGTMHLGSRNSESDLNQERLVHALTRLYELLEEYAPTWYTQKHHDIADGALHASVHGPRLALRRTT